MQGKGDLGDLLQHPFPDTTNAELSAHYYRHFSWSWGLSLGAIQCNPFKSGNQKPTQPN